MKEEIVSYVYVGRYECGCNLSVVVDDPKEKCRLYKKSIDIEPTVIAKALLYDLIIKGVK